MTFRNILSIFVLEKTVTYLLIGCLLIFFQSYNKGIIMPHSKLPIFYQIFGLLIFAPITEELAIRLCLIPSKSHIWIGFTSILINGCLYYLLLNNDVEHFIYFTGFFLTISLFFVLNYQILQKAFEANFPLIFYISAFIFAVLHFHSYTFTNIFQLMFIFIPLFISGIFLGYVRIKHGILYAIFYHFLLNFLPAMLILFKDYNSLKF